MVLFVQHECMSSFLMAHKHIIGHSVPVYLHQGWSKTDCFLRVDKFVTVSGKKACDMSKVCEFLSRKSIKLACQCI